jgi:ketosteroid isomerase-like protein
VVALSPTAVQPLAIATVADRDVTHALIAAELRWSDAVRRGDRADASSFMTDDFRMLSAALDTAPVGRHAWLDRVTSPSTLQAFEYDDFHIDVLYDVAAVRSRCREHGAPVHGVEPSPSTFRFTDVWQRTDGRWRVGLRHVGLAPN